MPSSPKQPPSTGAVTPLGMFGPIMEYMVDAAQRSVLFWDVSASAATSTVIIWPRSPRMCSTTRSSSSSRCRTLDRPVNYCLVQIVPPPVKVDARRRPFVIVDPRAGHGPGIGGFKADSEIGVAFKAGHPCYFVGFLPQPMPGQTIGDIARAEAVFLEKIIALHPEADGKPCVIGNAKPVGRS